MHRTWAVACAVVLVTAGCGQSGQPTVVAGWDREVPTTTRPSRPVAPEVDAAVLAARVERRAPVKASRSSPHRTRTTCTLEVIRQREAGGDYGAVSKSGTYAGAYQFDARTWTGAVSRAGFPEWAHRRANEAPPTVQDAAAQQLMSERGTQPWSTCR